MNSIMDIQISNSWKFLFELIALEFFYSKMFPEMNFKTLCSFSHWSDFLVSRFYLITSAALRASPGKPTWDVWYSCPYNCSDKDSIDKHQNRYYECQYVFWDLFRIQSLNCNLESDIYSEIVYQNTLYAFCCDSSNSS